MRWNTSRNEVNAELQEKASAGLVGVFDVMDAKLPAMRPRTARQNAFSLCIVYFLIMSVLMFAVSLSELLRQDFSGYPFGWEEGGWAYQSSHNYMLWGLIESLVTGFYAICFFSRKKHPTLFNIALASLLGLVLADRRILFAAGSGLWSGEPFAWLVWGVPFLISIGILCGMRRNDLHSP
jgi:hypothetical protein